MLGKLLVNFTTWRENIGSEPVLSRKVSEIKTSLTTDQPSRGNHQQGRRKQPEMRSNNFPTERITEEERERQRGYLYDCFVTDVAIVRE